MQTLNECPLFALATLMALAEQPIALTACVRHSLPR